MLKCSIMTCYVQTFLKTKHDKEKYLSIMGVVRTQVKK